MPERRPSAPRATAKKTTARPKAERSRTSAGPTRLSAVREVKQPARLATNPAAPIPHEEIQRRAFELWQSRGGDHIANWLEAETTLKRERAKVAVN